MAVLADRLHVRVGLQQPRHHLRVAFCGSKSKGLRPYLSAASTLALASSSLATTSAWPSDAARMRGVSPFLVTASTSAPALSNLSTSSAFPSHAACPRSVYSTGFPQQAHPLRCIPLREPSNSALALGKASPLLNPAAVLSPSLAPGPSWCPVCLALCARAPGAAHACCRQIQSYGMPICTTEGWAGRLGICPERGNANPRQRMRGGGKVAGWRASGGGARAGGAGGQRVLTLMWSTGAVAVVLWGAPSGS
mmetsp:Transcript_26086/g.83236  ORF Transcript_26086/g.83236 Transcript_26086/m.83236 type:complete len:251 (-) Transcript_26086:65-817(-)